MTFEKNAPLDIENYLAQHQAKGLLRFLTCGSVDDGKSTLIGRLLYDTKMVFEDQLHAAANESKKYGTQGDQLDFALLVDGLQSEREQGITIDVAYRFFTTEKRKYIIADTPGHEQYTRNMVTGASTADVAVILIDARKGVLTQTRRHSYIVNLLGIAHVIVAINKMDLVDFDQKVFEKIKEEYKALSHNLGIKNCYFVPLSALKGDNVAQPSQQMPWYQGATLLELLDTLDIEPSTKDAPLRLPVQYINRPHQDFRGICGTILSGQLQVGDQVTLLPSGKSTTVKQIISAKDVTEDKPSPFIDRAQAPMAVTLVMEDEIDISRGDMIVHSDQLPRVSNALKVFLVWMDENPLQPGVTYDIKHTTQIISGHIEKINYKVDVNTFERHLVEQLELNDIASCRLLLSAPIAADAYEKNRQAGSFIMIDRITNNTVAAGMILNVAKREENPVIQRHRQYTQAEIALNQYIREHFPEWGCKAID